MNKIIRLIHLSDLKLLYMFNDGLKCSVFDRLIPFVTGLGSAFFTVAVSLVLVFWGNGRLQAIGCQSIAALASSHIFVHYLKKVFTRPRPFLNLSDINTFNMHLYDYSFPSGHTTAAFSLACTLSFHFPILSWIFTIPAFIVGFSRVYMGVHYPSDVVVGMVIGAGFAAINHILFYSWMQQMFNL
ncbi:phosphatase PAP2 family protein [Geosporobacter ferrireducens]|uniref:Phosphatase PAP2 family protein n=1 Tax=Geosporobacter ferrireducens TaxID=1424294 RepID=A0A1D8GCF4_9FIRM|nr:phosphatase PAP2 family protein [Geosporobacter ferrireducens]AOT68595.1 phosphatase PAP2 family protein [Geosporobacter ferrireducens]MTI54064.1 phosphatase PAP2 family protein [Geosporobacter ferrireducens]